MHARPHRLPVLALAAAISAALTGSVAAAANDRIARLAPTQPGVDAATAIFPADRSWAATLANGRIAATCGWSIATEAGAPEPAGSAPLPDYGRAAGMAQAVAGSRVEIRLQQGRFDPLLEAPPVLPALAVRATSGDDADYHLVQFTGPIRSDWQEALRRRGIEIVDYVPDFAYIVRATNAAMAAVGTIDAVRWSGPYLPAWRLSQRLAEAAVRGGADEGRFLVRGFAGESARDLAAALQASGARVIGHGEDSGGGVILEVEAAASALLGMASVAGVAWIERRPEFRAMNSVARSNQFTRKDLVEQVAGYYGQGEIAAVTDTGLSTGNPDTIHADFAGRLVGATAPGGCGTWAGTNAHGTHVAGSVLGSGARSGSNPGAGRYAGSHAGIAPRAQLVMWATCDDFSGVPMTDPYTTFWKALYDFDPQLRTNNNSWGSASPDDQGSYNSFARETDRFIRDHPDMIAVFAAGNGGTDDDWDGISDFTTTSPPSTAKNVISVGASESLRASGGFNPGGPCGYWGECWPDNFPFDPLASDRISNHPDGMAAFSGRGPTWSNRLKPDLVAPGTNIVSARSEIAPTDTVWGIYDAYYLFEGGTSMAAPLVTGGTAIVREFFRREFAHNPSASLVKAVLMNSAADMSPGQYGANQWADVWRRPDVNQGWGRMDLANAVLFTQTRQPAYYEGFPGLSTNQVAEMTQTVRAGGSPLRITLAWLDAPGTEASQGALVNDLDLEVTAPGGTVYYGFGGITGQQRDRYNNFEEVDIASAPAGTWTIRVRGYNVPAGPQSFSLVVTGDLAPDDGIFRHGFER
ncbi:MAG: S8 family serine peptidase [Xanthomonadales bacterium]|nr:S8 family serine peptidase [Xanthomonadales bacterium]